MRRREALVCLAALPILLSCSGKESAVSDKTALMVSIEPQRYVLEQLVDSTYSVRSLVSHGTNPETFEPSTSERIAVDASPVYFATGVLPFEEKLKSSTSAIFVETSDGVDLLFDTHGHNHSEEGHDHDADPHYWSSISGVRTMSANMAKALCESFPEDSILFKRRLEQYNCHLDSLENALTSKLAGREGVSFAVWHPSLSYVARDFGLNQITLGLEGKDMSAKGLREAIEKAKARNVKVFFFQKEYDSRQAQTINDALGSVFYEINPLDYNWESQLTGLIDEIARAQ